MRVHFNIPQQALGYVAYSVYKQSTSLTIAEDTAGILTSCNLFLNLKDNYRVI